MVLDALGLGLFGSWGYEFLSLGGALVSAPYNLATTNTTTTTATTVDDYKSCST